MAKLTRYYAVTHDSEESEGWTARDIEKLLHDVDEVVDVTSLILSVAAEHKDTKVEVTKHDPEDD